MDIADVNKCIAEGRHLTPGQVAHVLKVAVRTVTKWFDAGKLRGYRLPLSQDRRIPLDSLVEFIRENKIPGIDLITSAIVVLSDNRQVVDAAKLAAEGRCRLVEVADLFHLGQAVGSESLPPVVVLDLAYPGAATVARSLVAKVPVVAILPEGASASDYHHGQGFRCVELPASVESIQGVIVRAWEGMQ